MHMHLYTFAHMLHVLYTYIDGHACISISIYMYPYIYTAVMHMHLYTFVHMLHVLYIYIHGHAFISISIYLSMSI